MAHNKPKSEQINLGNVTLDTILGPDGEWLGDPFVAGSNTQIQFNDDGAFGAVANLVFNKATGNLGIGAVVPIAQVHVYDPTNLHAGYVIQNADIYAGIELETQTATANGEGILNIGINTGRLIPTSGATANQYDSGWMRVDSRPAYREIAFMWRDAGQDATNTYMTVKNSGYVGIGNTSPSATLHVSGTIKDTPVLTITGNATYADNAAGKIIMVDSASAVTVTFAAASTADFSITVIRKGAGNVTIATSGVTKLNTASFTTSNVNARYESAIVVYSATNEIILMGSIL